MAKVAKISRRDGAKELVKDWPPLYATPVPLAVIDDGTRVFVGEK